MKKVIFAVVALVLCIALGIGIFGWLNGWFCSHEWSEPDCTTPMTCSKCGSTEGMPEGHIWLAATCLEPRTCEVCGTTKEEPKGHDWQEASCDAPKTCLRCHLTEGEALGHIWQEATTEAPKTCENCGATEGEKITTDPRFTTAATQDLYGEWRCELELNAEALGVTGMEGSLGFVYVLNFSNVGDLRVGFEVADEEGFTEALLQVTLANIYKENEAQGHSKEGVDTYYQETYGMSTEEYCREMLKGLSINEIMKSVYKAMDIGGVYYVADGKLYQGLTWDAEMTATEYTLEGDTLKIAGFNETLGAEAVFVRAVEE